MDTAEKRIKALKWLKVEDIWGIGIQHAKRLHAINVNSAYDFTQLDDVWVKKYLAIVGIRLNGKYIPSKLFTTGDIVASSIINVFTLNLDDVFKDLK